MSWPYKLFIEVVHSVNHQSVYHVQFHPSPFLYMGNQEIAKGGQGPYESIGMLRHLKESMSLGEVNLYTNLPSKDLKEMMEGFQKDCPKTRFKVKRLE